MCCSRISTLPHQEKPVINNARLDNCFVSALIAITALAIVSISCGIAILSGCGVQVSAACHFNVLTMVCAATVVTIVAVSIIPSVVAQKRKALVKLLVLAVVLTSIFLVCISLTQSLDIKFTYLIPDLNLAAGIASLFALHVSCVVYILISRLVQKSRYENIMESLPIVFQDVRCALSGKDSIEGLSKSFLMKEANILRMMCPESKKFETLKRALVCLEQDIDLLDKGVCADTEESKNNVDSVLIMMRQCQLIIMQMKNQYEFKENKDHQGIATSAKDRLLEVIKSVENKANAVAVEGLQEVLSVEQEQMLNEVLASLPDEDEYVECIHILKAFLSSIKASKKDLAEVREDQSYSQAERDEEYVRYCEEVTKYLEEAVLMLDVLLCNFLEKVTVHKDSGLFGRFEAFVKKVEESQKVSLQGMLYKPFHLTKAEVVLMMKFTAFLKKGALASLVEIDEYRHKTDVVMVNSEEKIKIKSLLASLEDIYLTDDVSREKVIYLLDEVLISIDNIVASSNKYEFNKAASVAMIAKAQHCIDEIESIKSKIQ